MTSVVEWGRLCSRCRAVRDRYVNGASGVLCNPWVGVVEDVVERCGCAVGPSLESAVRRYLEDGRRWSSSFPGVLDATRRHVEQGVELHLRRWVSSGELECGVDGCTVAMLDPASTSWFLVFTPGLDVAPICSSCLEHARRWGEPVYWWCGSYFEGVGHDVEG